MKCPSPSQAKAKLILAMGIFGTIGLFVRRIPLPSSLIANVRGVIGMLFLLFVLALRHERLQTDAIRRNLKFLLPCGVMLGFNWLLLFEAYRFTSVAVATVRYYLAPVFVLLFSPLLFRERLTLLRALCAFVALVGMVLTSGVVQNGFSGNFRGILLALGAAGMYAAIVLLSKFLRDIPAYDITAVELGISAVVLLPYNLLTVDWQGLTCSVGELGLLLLVGIVHTGIAYTLYFGAIPDLRAQTAAIFSYIDPIVAILLSALLLREPMDMLSALGAVLVLGSTFVGELWDGKISVLKSKKSEK